MKLYVILPNFLKQKYFEFVLWNWDDQTLMVTSAKNLGGVKIIDLATKDARENIKLNRVDNTTSVRADANKIEDVLAKYHFEPDTIILDPPCKGIEPQFIYTIFATTCKRMIYVSCNPSTFARDIKFFRKPASCSNN